MTSIFVQKDNLKYQFSTAILQTYFRADDIAILQDIAILYLQPETNNNRKCPKTQKPQESVGVFVHFFKAQMKSFNPFIQASQSF